MTREEMQRVVFNALNREENEEIVTLALAQEKERPAVLIQWSDGIKYKIWVEETEEQF